MSDNRESVILLGTDTPIGLAIMRDLNANGFRAIGVGREPNGVGASSKSCSRFYLRNPDPKELIAQLLDVAKRHGARYLLAIAESDLVFLNDHRNDLIPELIPLIAPAAQLDQVINKARTLEAARKVGICVPKTFELKNASELSGVIADISFPVVLKWSDPNRVAEALSEQSIDLRKAEFAMDPAQLEQCLARYNKIDELPLIQQYCPGVGIGHMFLARNGSVLMEFQHERIHEWPAEGGVSTLCRSVSLEKGIDARARSVELIKALNWTGVAMVEYRLDKSKNTYCLMEINGRFWGSLPLAIGAGVPFAAALVAICGRGDEPSTWCRKYLEIDGVFGLPEVRRLIRLIMGRGGIQDPLYVATPWRDLRRYVRAMLRYSTVFYVFQWRDPGPFLADLRNMIFKVLRRSR